jgi:ABC-type nitrate/sulfonate/bicarbonate transport system substrate-binding protein
MGIARAAGVALLSQLVASCTAPPPASGSAVGARTAPATVRFIDLINLDVRDVPLLIALDDLAAQGYRIEKRYLSGSAMMTDLLARGEADLAMVNNQSAWAAAVKGAPIRTISQFTGSSGLLAAGAHVRTCADLDRRRVGIPSGSGPSRMQLTLFVERHCPGARPQTLAIAESAARAAALVSGRLDASLLPGEGLFKLQRQATAPVHVLMTYAEEFPDVEIDGLHVNRGWAAEHPEVVRDFVRAQVRAYRAVRRDPDRLVAEASKRLSIDSETARAVAEWHLQRGMWDANGGLTPRTVQSTIEFFQKSGALPAGVAPADVADLSYLEAVLDELGREEDTPSKRSPQPK